MKELRVGVVGCGYWAPNLVRNLVGLRGVEMVALADVDLSRAESLAGRMAPRAALVNDHRRLCEDPSLDAIFVATPVRAHFSIARDVILSGKHVFVEKPLAPTVAECEELVRLSEAQGVVLMVGHVFEYNAAVIRAKEYLNSGELGQPLYIYSQRVNLGRIQSDINALWSYAPHDISILNYWLEAEPVSVSVRGFHCLGQKVEDVVFATLMYPGGVGAHLHLGWLDPRKIRQMTLVGTKKMLVYDDVSNDAPIQIFDKGVNNFHEFIQAPDTFAEFRYEIREAEMVVPRVRFIEPLMEECRHFVDCVRSGARPRTDGRNALRVVRALEAAQHSLENDGIEVMVANAQGAPAPSAKPGRV